jgi:hypothetical protein
MLDWNSGAGYVIFAGFSESERRPPKDRLHYGKLERLSFRSLPLRSPRNFNILILYPVRRHGVPPFTWWTVLNWWPCTASIPKSHIGSLFADSPYSGIYLLDILSRNCSTYWSCISPTNVPYWRLDGPPRSWGYGQLWCFIPPLLLVSHYFAYWPPKLVQN